MALTDDQRAMLRLLARREEGYEDIAALMGISVEEVRAKVKDALAGLDESAGAPTQPSPPADPEPQAVAPKPQAKPRAEPPRAAATPPADPPPPTTMSRPRPSLPRLRLPEDRRRLAEVTGAALIALLVVLFASGAIDLGGGDGDDSASQPAGAGNGATELTSGEEEKLTQARLQPVGGSEASGQAIFGRVGKDEVVLQVTAEDLEPTPKGEAYTVWLFQSPKLALRVGSVNVGEPGELGARFPIPAELLGYVASGAFPQIHVTRTENAAYQREVAQAEKQERLPRYSGETVLRGKITGPIVQQGANGNGGG